MPPNPLPPTGTPTGDPPATPKPQGPKPTVATTEDRTARHHSSASPSTSRIPRAATSSSPSPAGSSKNSTASALPASKLPVKLKTPVRTEVPKVGVGAPTKSLHTASGAGKAVARPSKLPVSVSPTAAPVGTTVTATSISCGIARNTKRPSVSAVPKTESNNQRQENRESSALQRKPEDRLTEIKENLRDMAISAASSSRLAVG
ncbi:hypothetical protein BZA05DRAFT_451850, partial [Tricharina praecox]|uniref:uncharacterized protein n=1 Tax=Tricharina praecox TaxID=43433 RepID=UPI002220B818